MDFGVAIFLTDECVGPDDLARMIEFHSEHNALATLAVEQRAAVLGQVKSPEISVDKRSVSRAAIDGGADVPGREAVRDVVVVY